MNKILLFSFLLLMNSLVYSEEYETNNKIINIKYGFQLGDLIIIEDKIISNKNYLQSPKLVIQKNKHLKLIKQTSKINKVDDKHIFFNKIIYQNFQKTKNGLFNLPVHKYNVNKKTIQIGTKSYWFTRVSESSLNKALFNSIDQRKPTLIRIKNTKYYFLLGIIFLLSLILIYKNVDFPFIRRMNGPFAKAHRKIKILNKNKKNDNYVKSILVLTDAFNKTFKQNINNFNLYKFTEENKKYHIVKNEIKIFVEVSSVEIYSSKTFFTKVRFNDIYNFSKLLRSIERKI